MKTQKVKQLMDEMNTIFKNIITRPNFKITELTNEDRQNLDRTKQIYFELRSLGLKNSEIITGKIS